MAGLKLRPRGPAQRHPARSGQSGAALIVGLVLLVIMMVSGIAAMRGTALNEKATSNQRNKTISLMAAETGINQFYQWFASATSSTFPVTAPARNAWQTGQTYPIPTTATGALNANVGSGSFGYFWVDPASVAWDTAAETVSMTVTGHALSATTSGAIVSTSQIDVTMKRPGLALIPSMPAAPLAVVGDVSSFNAASSNNFSISSGSGPAIATTSAASTSTITSAIPGNRANNYTGVNTDGTACANPCVQTLGFGSTWGDASALESLIRSLTGNLTGSGMPTGVAFYSGNTTFSPSANSLSNSTPVTIVTGNVSFSGNPADYTGLLIVLGGSVSVSGGGNFNINGGLFLANVNTSASPWTFGATTSGVTGGGGMSITYNSNPGNIGGGNPFQNWKER
jgi:Tfp pilus assembly protein PilX